MSQKKVMEKRRLQRSHLESLSTWLFNFLQNERIKTFSVYTSRFGQLLFLISQPWTCINFIITLTTSLFFLLCISLIWSNELISYLTYFHLKWFGEEYVDIHLFKDACSAALKSLLRDILILTRGFHSISVGK